eukprot:SAG31_NODE_7573_length_1650_cov_9.010316_1_plen_36_part_10
MPACDKLTTDVNEDLEIIVRRVGGVVVVPNIFSGNV